MLNGNMLKPTNEICLKCKYQLKQKTVTREKMLQLIKSAFFEKLIWSFQIDLKFPFMHKWKSWRNAYQKIIFLDNMTMLMSLLIRFDFVSVLLQYKDTCDTHSFLLLYPKLKTKN